MCSSEVERVTEADKIAKHVNTLALYHNGRQPEKPAWPEPLSLSPAPEQRPGINANVLPAWCASHVRSVAESVQVPRSLPTMVALSTMAGAVQKAAVVQLTAGYAEPLILWTCSVLPSGERKSPTFTAMTSPVTAHEHDERERLSEQHSKALAERDVLEGRLQRAKKAAEKGGTLDAMHEAREALESHEVPSLPLLWVNDVTPESLAREMQDNGGRMIVMSPEGDLFTYMSGRYGQAVSLDLYKKGWTGSEPFRDTRMGREGHDIPDPALSIGICTQPDVLRRLRHAQTFRGEGVLARFLWCYPKSLMGYREGAFNAPELDCAAAANYERHIRGLLRLPRPERPPLMQVSDEGASVWQEFAKSIEERLRPEGDLRHIADWAGKLPGQVARIAGVLAIADDGRIPAEIKADLMRRAVAIGRSCIPHALGVFGLIGADQRTEMARYVLSRIQAKWRPGFTRSDLWQACRDKVELVRSSDLEEPLSLLEELKHIAIQEQSHEGPGRPPSDLIHLNPKSVTTP